MTFKIAGDTLLVSDVRELSAMTSKSFRDEVRANLTETQTAIEIDLSGIGYINSCGLGALVSLYKIICARNGLVRLINPTASVQSFLDITRVHRFFEIIKR